VIGPDPDDLRVPDDARELDPDVAAYYREQRREHRRHRAGRLLFTRRWVRYGLSGPLVVVILMGVAAVGSLATVLRPQIESGPRPRPLANVSASPGTEGGLLPDGQLQMGNFERDIRGLRPAVIALVPSDCSCDSAVAAAFEQTVSYRIKLYLAGHPRSADELRRLSRDAGNGTATVVLDTQGALFEAYEPAALTLVLVHIDGVVEAVVREPQAYRLGPDLAVLSRPKYGV
jgi:hypothetical protein